MTKWFLEFFLSSRVRQGDEGGWGFGLIAEVLERGWIVWVLKRMREAVEDKVFSHSLVILSFLKNQLQMPIY